MLVIIALSAVIGLACAQIFPPVQSPQVIIQGQNQASFAKWGFNQSTTIYQQLVGNQSPLKSHVKQMGNMSKPDGRDTLNMLLAEIQGEIDHA